METGPQKSIFKFGVFELDPQTGELRKHGVKLKLQQQPLQVLTVLLEREGDVVTREDIQKRLWADDTYVDFDNSINSSIRKLREALADSHDTPRFIETLPRRGYRFIAPVHRSSPASPVPAPAGISTGPNSTQSNGNSPVSPLQPGRLGWLVIATVSLVVMGLFISLWRSKPGQKTDTANALLNAVPFTSDPGFQVLPSFSPEGTRVAFTWQQANGKKPDVYVKLVGSGQAVRLSKAGGFAPAWSPDGKFIAFLRPAEDPWHAAIIVIPSIGGPEREVTGITFDAASVVFRYGWPVPGPFLAWSPDCKWLLALEQQSPTRSKPYEIVRVSVESGEKRVLTSAPANGLRGGGLSLAPDGARLAFTQDSGFWARDIYVVPLSADLLITAKPEQLTFDHKGIAGLAWTNNGKDLVFSSPRNGKPELWKITAEQGSHPVRLGSIDDEVTDLAISADGQHLVYAHQINSQNIWRASLNGQHVFAPRSLIASTRRDTQARYSPDGTQIAFESNRSGNEEVWICDADSSNMVQLTHFGNAWAGAPKWSPDGREIAFAANPAGNWNIYIVSSGGGKPRRLTPAGADQSWPSWSRDGKWIYYFSNRRDQIAVRKMPAAGGPELQVTNDGGVWSDESYDGTNLFYVNEKGIMEVPVLGGTATSIAESYAFASAKSGLYYSPGTSGPEPPNFTLDFLDGKTHRTRTLGVLPGPLGWNFDVSPDERWIIYSRTEREGSELMFVDHFQ